MLSFPCDLGRWCFCCKTDAVRTEDSLLLPPVGAGRAGEGPGGSPVRPPTGVTGLPGSPVELLSALSAGRARRSMAGRSQRLYSCLLQVVLSSVLECGIVRPQLSEDAHVLPERRRVYKDGCSTGGGGPVSCLQNPHGVRKYRVVSMLEIEQCLCSA